MRFSSSILLGDFCCSDFILSYNYTLGVTNLSEILFLESSLSMSPSALMNFPTLSILSTDLRTVQDFDVFRLEYSFLKILFSSLNMDQSSRRSAFLLVFLVCLSFTGVSTG